MATFDSAIGYIQKAEGGLSRAVTDSASANPSPYVVNGVSGWHTNRGITWGTFQQMAPIVGYSVNQDNFINMPDWIWLGIYKQGYWNPIHGDDYNSQPIANAVVDFAWGSGIGGATKQVAKFLAQNGVSGGNAAQNAQGMNQLVVNNGENKTFNDFIDFRKQFFVGLNQPANQKGWLSRMDTLRTQGLSLITEGIQEVAQTVEATATETGQLVKQNVWIQGGITLLFIFSLNFIYNRFKK